MAKKNGGNYPAMKVASVLSGKTSLAAYGSQEMPVWGPVFWRMSQGHPVEVQLRIANLNDYIKSLQVNKASCGNLSDCSSCRLQLLSI